jgi:hypothetical protein
MWYLSPPAATLAAVEMLNTAVIGGGRLIFLKYGAGYKIIA